MSIITRPFRVFLSRDYDSNLGQMIDSYINTTITFTTGVDTQEELPIVGNSLYDVKITKDYDHMYVWTGSKWVDQGGSDNYDYVSHESLPGPVVSSSIDWSDITNKPESDIEDIDDAVNDRHPLHADDQDISGKLDIANSYKFLTFTARQMNRGAVITNPANAFPFGASAVPGGVPNWSMTAFGGIGTTPQDSVSLCFQMPANYNGTPIKISLDYFTNTTANTGGPGAMWEILYQKLGNDVLSPANPQDSLPHATETALLTASAGRLRHYKDEVTLPFTNQGLPVAGNWVYIGIRRTYAGGVGVEYSAPLLLANVTIIY